MQVPCRAPNRSSCDISYYGCCCGQVGGLLKDLESSGPGDNWNSDPGGRARGEVEGTGGQSPWGSRWVSSLCCTPALGCAQSPVPFTGRCAQRLG